MKNQVQRFYRNWKNVFVDDYFLQKGKSSTIRIYFVVKQGKMLRDRKEEETVLPQNSMTVERVQRKLDQREMGKNFL